MNLRWHPSDRLNHIVLLYICFIVLYSFHEIRLHLTSPFVSHSHAIEFQQILFLFAFHVVLCLAVELADIIWYGWSHSQSFNLILYMELNEKKSTKTKESQSGREIERMVLLMRFFHVYLTENTVLFAFNFSSNYFCYLIWSSIGGLLCGALNSAFCLPFCVFAFCLCTPFLCECVRMSRINVTEWMSV